MTQFWSKLADVATKNMKGDEESLGMCVFASVAFQYFHILIFYLRLELEQN